eukprot:255357_1
MADAGTALTTGADDSVQTNQMRTVQDDATKRKKLIYGAVAIILTIILIIVIIVATTSGSSSSSTSNTWPVMVTTWPGNAQLTSLDHGFRSMQESTSKYPSLDGVLEGVKYCQETCNTGRSNVDTNGEVTQSAMVMWGPTMESGSVANLYGMNDAVSVAFDVMVYTDHAIIVGEAATRFAQQMGYPVVLQNDSATMGPYYSWVNGNCSNNQHWRNVQNGDQCLIETTDVYVKDTEADLRNVTGCAGAQAVEPQLSATINGAIAMIAIDSNGDMSLATSSNGLQFKIAGRVSDAAVPGSGGYIDPDVGGCVATGAGDTLIRFVPAKTAVTFMKAGSTPQEAAQFAIDEIEKYCKEKQSIILCLSKDGTPGIAYHKKEELSFGYGYVRENCAATVANQTNPTPCV